MSPSWWRRLVGGARPKASAPRAASPPPPPVEPALAAVSGQDARGLDALDPSSPAPLADALAALRAAEGSTRERAAIEAVLRARGAGRAPEELLVALAGLLGRRGEPERALTILLGLRSNAALLMAADLLAAQGLVADALARVERVMARDLGWPGARERHTRWAERLGRAPARPPSAAEPTVLRHELPVSSLRIVGEAGRGGAGVVYEAVDDALERRVALKVYHHSSAERSQLEREARLAVELAGPGVVRVFDLDPERGWLIMEWLPSGALKRWLTRADVELLWPIERWFTPLIRALARVHAAGLVHADLKPANVLFRDPSSPLVSDFGLAAPPGTRSEGGSLGYLSPERLSSGILGYSDDVYALGRILEDALDVLSRPRPAGEALARWREVAERATAPASGRPADASALLAVTLRQGGTA
ncbi:MAG: serine/threonine-protein kinase [Sorangiineae bacterium]|nr:serine/threonine-protein kinase [Polyangiaceae bacterium]MEB2324801.1 serine/threonine-protein kinase [Sorangiineae bacterium]